MGVDVKVAQELLRHANSRTTMDLYTQAVSADKRSASGRQVDFLLAEKKGAFAYLWEFACHYRSATNH